MSQWKKKIKNASLKAEKVQWFTTRYTYNIIYLLSIHRGHFIHSRDNLVCPYFFSETFITVGLHIPLYTVTN